MWSALTNLLAYVALYAAFPFRASRRALGAAGRRPHGGIARRAQAGRCAAVPVLYVKGEEDLQPVLADLQLKVQTLDPAPVPAIDLSGYTTVLIGRGALAAGALDGALPALGAFLRRSGTVVVLAGGSEVAGSGLFPYAMTFDSNPPAIRDPAASVRATSTRSRLLRWPNMIGAGDFEGWTGTRASGLPNDFDSAYENPLSIASAKDAAVRGALLSARVG